MAVEQIATEAKDEVSTNTVLREELTKPTRQAVVTAKSESVDTKIGETEIPRNQEAVLKKEMRARETAEILLHLYSGKDKTKRQNPKCFVYSNGDDSVNESDMFDDDWFDNYDFYCGYDIIDYKRTSHLRAKRDRAPPKERKFAKFCREHEAPVNVILQKGNRKSIRVKYNKCVTRMSRDSNRKEQTERRKANIEKKLRKLGIQRRGSNAVGRNGTGNKPQKPEKFELNEENVPKEMQDMLDFLMDLQDREVTPEDYELLLKLDELIPTKTVSEEILQRLQEEVVVASHTEEVCGICMEDYKIGEIRKILPCKHVFHAGCVSQWLGQSSTKCPLDGLEL